MRLFESSSPWGALLCALIVSTAGCAPDDDVDATEQQVRESFDRHNVLVDDALTDADSLTVEDVQAMLEATPHGNRSVLADYSSHGRTAAQAIIDAAQAHGINPIAILTRSQMEQSLIGKSSASSRALDWAMGCGCPDNQSCFEAYRGFDTQVDCMAERMSTYLDELDEDGETVAGWQVGVPKTTLDGLSVRPHNRATAALYTYTPWVSSNELHHSIFRKYATFFGYEVPAPGGCGALTYPSGVRIQLVPAPALEAQYDGADAPRCFVDSNRLSTPEGTSLDASVKLADNFRLYEFANAASSSAWLMKPQLVEALQSLRDRVGAPISINVSYRSPDAQRAECASSSAPSCELGGALVDGAGVLVESSVGSDALLDAAARAGVPSCWPEGDLVFLGVGAAHGCGN